jgi:hypothetical protein
MALRSDRRVDAAKRHVEAVYAFHAGLLAETDRHRYVLMQMARHITVLRQLEQSSEKKLEAAEAACRHLAALEELRRPWMDTHRDFRRSLRLTRALYREIVKSMDRGDRH